jgi:hypothetical protein
MTSTSTRLGPSTRPVATLTSTAQATACLTRSARCTAAASAPFSVRSRRTWTAAPRRCTIQVLLALPPSPLPSSLSDVNGSPTQTSHAPNALHLMHNLSKRRQGRAPLAADSVLRRVDRQPARRPGGLRVCSWLSSGVLCVGTRPPPHARPRGANSCALCGRLHAHTAAGGRGGHQPLRVGGLQGGGCGGVRLPAAAREC